MRSFSFRSYRFRGITPGAIEDERLRLAAERFVQFHSKLKRLVTSIRTHYGILVRQQSSRESLLEAFGSLSVSSPIAPLIRSNEHSYSEVCSELLCDLDSLKEMVVYADEWEQSVSTRVFTEIKHVIKLQNEWARCVAKLEHLKVTFAKKKHQSAADLTKMKRNEAKLRTARKEYRRNLICVTLLTEEVTDRGWKDLVPLMMKMLQFDLTIAEKAVGIKEKLESLHKEMRNVAVDYYMKEEDIPEGRLKCLQEEEALDFMSPTDLEGIDLEPTVFTKSSSGESPNKRDDEDDGIPTIVTPVPIQSTKKAVEGYECPEAFFIICEKRDSEDDYEDDLTTLTPYTRYGQRVSV